MPEKNVNQFGENWRVVPALETQSLLNVNCKTQIVTTAPVDFQAQAMITGRQVKAQGFPGPDGSNHPIIKFNFVCAKAIFQSLSGDLNPCQLPPR
jgi:hypothetical protein